MKALLTALCVSAVAALAVASCTQQAAEPVDMYSRDIVPDSAEQVRPLLPGMSAPAFELQQADGAMFAFDPEGLERPVVLSFYRGGWCPYCNRHLQDMRLVEERLIEMGFDVQFVSADRYEVIKESLNMEDVNFTLLADNDLDVAKRFGLAFRVDDATVARYLDNDIDLEAASGREHHMLPIPATFVIDKDGTIQFQYANPNYRVRVNPEVLLAAAAGVVAADGS